MTMKRFLLLTGFFPLLCYLFAQVGINTQNPQGVFHVDAKGDTNGSANISDDIIVDADGNLGIGTLSPTTKLHIKTDALTPGIRIENASVQNGYVLATDNSGVGSWNANVSTAYAKWRITNTNFNFTGVAKQFSATSAATVNFESTIAGVTHSINSISVPQGRYFVFMVGNVVGEENLLIYFNAVTGGVTSTLYYFNIEHSLPGCVMSLNLSSTTTLYLGVLARNAKETMRNGLTPPFTASAWFEINLLKL